MQKKKCYILANRNRFEAKIPFKKRIVPMKYSVKGELLHVLGNSISIELKIYIRCIPNEIFDHI